MKKILTLKISKAIDVEDNIEKNLDEICEESFDAEETTKFLRDNGWDVELSSLSDENEVEDEDIDPQKIKVEDVNTIKVKAYPVFWEDGEINGEDDDNYEPKMPFVKTDNFGEKYWEIEIETKTGKIINWENGLAAKVHYKSVDENQIKLFNKNGKLLLEYTGYVPDFLSIDDEGYGDYIIFTIEEDGTIENFDFTMDDIRDLIENEL